MRIVIKSRAPSRYGEALSVAAEDENGAGLSAGVFTLTETRYGENRIETMLVGGLETPVVNRRRGCIREMLSYMHAYGAEHGAALALLHPFSFPFYGKFGYERAADHIIAECPVSCLDFVPRCCELVPYDSSRLADMIRIYDEFSRGRNLLLPRRDESQYTGDGRQAYIYYDGGVPSAYVVVTGKKSLYVNHYTDTVLTVREIAYTGPAALGKIFSFLRMFEGEYERIEFRDCSLCPEIDLTLRRYAQTEFKILPDLAACVLNTEKLLDAHTYPCGDGTFTVRVKDCMDSVAGLFRVSYGKGGHEVRRLAEGDADLTVNAAALTRIIYGAGVCDTRGLSYLHGVTVHKDCTDLIRAFPDRPRGVFEHF